MPIKYRNNPLDCVTNISWSKRSAANKSEKLFKLKDFLFELWIEVNIGIVLFFSVERSKAGGIRHHGLLSYINM